MPGSLQRRCCRSVPLPPSNTIPLARYRDCAAGVAAATPDAPVKRNRCADYLDHVYDSWILAQRSGMCSEHKRAELPEAYVAYWREKGLGLSSRYRSPWASVREFLDSQIRRC